MDYDHYQQNSPSSFKQKLKSSLCSSCCFLSYNQISSRTEFEEQYPEKSPTDHQNNQIKNSPSSPSSWIKSRANLSDEIKEKLLHLLNRIGKRKGNHYYDTSEFSYDPLSYALNFDDDTRFNEYLHLRDVTARLPQSPKRKMDKNMNSTAVMVPRQVAAWS